MEVVEFCRARERLKAAERATRDERAEQNDAQRTLGGLLSESMERHRLQCVALPPIGDVPQYARLSGGGRSACAIRSTEDALALVRGVAESLPRVALEDLPAEVPKAVMARARERGKPQPVRVRLASRPPRTGVTEASLAAAETRQLSEQFVRAAQEVRTSREALKPLREEMRRCERAAAPLVAAEAARVQMERGGNRPAVVLEVAPLESGGRAARLGLRQVCRVAGEAAAEVVARRVARDGFDAALAAEVERRLSEQPAPTAAAATRLRVRRAPANGVG